MKISVPYGSRPEEKIISEGYFACPSCNYKRSYARKKVVKVNYWGLINIPSSNALMEYIQCGGCLNAFPVEVIEPGNQLKIQVYDHPLPPDSLFDQWQAGYAKLQCEELLNNDPSVREINSALISTSATNMQHAGVAIKLKMVDDVKKCMYNILELSNRWFELNMKENNQFAKKNPSMDVKHRQFSAAAHYILSKLP